MGRSETTGLLERKEMHKIARLVRLLVKGRFASSRCRSVVRGGKQCLKIMGGGGSPM